MITKNIFSARLRSLRLEKNITQQKLAELFNSNVQRASNWENGVSYPNVEVLAGLADYFGVSVDYLIGRSQDPFVFIACNTNSEQLPEAI